MDLYTPEHDKLHAIKHKSQAIGEFLDWCENSRKEGLTLCRYQSGYEVAYSPCDLGRDKLLAEHFGIDLDKLEDEKQAMLDLQRKVTNAATANDRMYMILARKKPDVPAELALYLGATGWGQIGAAIIFPEECQARSYLQELPTRQEAPNVLYFPPEVVAHRWSSMLQEA